MPIAEMLEAETSTILNANVNRLWFQNRLSVGYKRIQFLPNKNCTFTLPSSITLHRF